MIVTLEQLKKRNACEAALVVFEAAVGRQTADFEFSPAAQGLMLADPLWRKFIGWGWANGIIPMWSMSRADLRGADLWKADLRGADLWEADLSGADLSGADLSGAKWNEETTWPAGFANAPERAEGKYYE